MLNEDEDEGPNADANDLGPGTDIQVITDQEANEIYLKVSQHVANRKGYIKKNWTDDETKLLKWAVITYTRQRSITYQ